MANPFYYPTLLFKLIFKHRKERTLCSPELGFKITIPKNFEILSDKQIARLVKKGEKEFEGIIQKRNLTPEKRLLVMTRYEMQNRFSINIANLGEITEAEWKNQNDLLFNNTLKIYHFRFKDYSRVDISTESGRRQKGDIVFDRQDIIAKTPTRELYRSCFYSTVYKGYGLRFLMAFANEEAGEKMLNIMRNATFE